MTRASTMLLLCALAMRTVSPSLPLSSALPRALSDMPGRSSDIVTKLPFSTKTGRRTSVLRMARPGCTARLHGPLRGLADQAFGLDDDVLIEPILTDVNVGDIAFADDSIGCDPIGQHRHFDDRMNPTLDGHSGGARIVGRCQQYGTEPARSLDRPPSSGPVGMLVHCFLPGHCRL